MIRPIWLCTLLFLGAKSAQAIAAPICITKYPSEADCIVYETTYRSENDSGVWYFTKYKSEARCRY